MWWILLIGIAFVWALNFVDYWQTEPEKKAEKFVEIVPDSIAHTICIVVEIGIVSLIDFSEFSVYTLLYMLAALSIWPVLYLGIGMSLNRLLRGFQLRKVSARH